MFFVNGQGFNVILVTNGVSQLMHEPVAIVPRVGELLFYQGHKYHVKSVTHYYPDRPIHRKPTIYLECEV